MLGQFLENGAVIVGLILAQAPLVDYGIVPPGADGTPPFIVLPVLYGLGSVMAVSALLYRLRPRVLWAVAGLVVLAVAWITPDPSSVGERFHPLLRLFFVPGQSGHLLVIYSTVPLLPAALLGLAFGHSILNDRQRAFAHIALVGALFLATFVVLRSAGGFGNFDVPRPGWIGFLNMTKYPPSLTFLLMTLGVDFLLLAAIERGRIAERWWSGPLLVFGSTPFFFFVVHMWLYAAMGRLVPTGLPMAQMYPFWLLGLVLLYMPCRWYGDVKRRQPVGSVWRMF